VAADVLRARVAAAWQPTSSLSSPRHPHRRARITLSSSRNLFRVAPERDTVVDQV